MPMQVLRLSLRKQKKAVSMVPVLINSVVLGLTCIFIISSSIALSNFFMQGHDSIFSMVPVLINRIYSFQVWTSGTPRA